MNNNLEQDKNEELNQSSTHPKSDSNDFLTNSEENEVDDLFERLDRMRGITDEQLKEKELQETGTIDKNEQVTKAIQTLSEEDQDVFERTGMIHFDRDIPIEQQVTKAIELQKQKETHQKNVFHIILGLMITGILISVIGLTINLYINRAPVNATATAKSGEELLKIDETTFPDSVFREYIFKNIDLDHDEQLSQDEMDAVLIINIIGDPELTNVKGIENFTQLQAITIENSGLTEIDLSKQTMLTNISLNKTKLRMIDLSNNHSLTHIDISNCEELKEVILPVTSQVQEVEVENTKFVCTKNDQNYYDACKIESN